MYLQKKDQKLEMGEVLPLMEAFNTIQGEGYYKGSAAYFIRVGGCDVGCHWCDVKESWNPNLHPVTSITKIIDAAKGYYGRRKNVFRVARQAVDKARQYAYRDRRVRKRDFRSLWIQRINAAVRLHGLTYSQFIHGFSKTEIELDRKMLSEIAIADPDTFKNIVETVKSKL